MTASLNLAVIGNAILGALIDPDGKIVWCCFPRLDGDPIFCGLLTTEDQGIFDIDLVDRVKSEQSYINNTAVVVTTLTDRMGGVVRITDFVPRLQHYERTFRPTMLVRRVEPIAGTPRLRVRIRPRFNYGATKPAVTHGSNHIRYQSADTAVRITTDAPITYILEEAPFILASPLTFILGPDEPIAGSIGGQARDYLERTVEYWQEWVRYLSVPFEWQDAVIRAAITLKLCSYEETGAIVAALTTSIPEHPPNDGEPARNWDYRYCWLRDAYYVVQALNRLGAADILENYLGYLRNLVDQAVRASGATGHIQPVYGVGLEPVL